METTDAFCAGDARSAVEGLRSRYAEVDACTRALLRWLAVDEKAWARPEESLGVVHDFVLAVRQAQRFHKAARERAARLSRWKDAGAAAVGGGGGPGARSGIVDGVAEKFHTQPGGGATGNKPAGNSDRSAELLRAGPRMLAGWCSTGRPRPWAAQSRY